MKKRTCYGCRALNNLGKHDGHWCRLGYEMEDQKTTMLLIYNPVPKEECPKPTSWNKLFDLISERRQQI